MDRHTIIGLWGVAGLVMLTSCASLAPASPPVAVKQVCLPLKTYSTADQKAASAALAALDPANPLVAFMEDYSALRSADRACLASTQGNP